MAGGLSMKEPMMVDPDDLSEKCHTFRTNQTRLLSRRTQLESRASARLRGVHLLSTVSKPYQNRIKSLSETTIGVVRRAKSRFPRLLERLKKRETEWTVWKGVSRAQGRRAAHNWHTKSEVHMGNPGVKRSNSLIKRISVTRRRRRPAPFLTAAGIRLPPPIAPPGFGFARITPETPEMVEKSLASR
jgi:hypothetical protein